MTALRFFFILMFLVVGVGFGQLNCGWTTTGEGPTVGWGTVAIAGQSPASGGVAPYVFEYAPGATPIPGFKVTTQTNGLGFIRGVTTTPGLYGTRLRCRDASNATQEFDVSFRVATFDLFAPNLGQFGNGETFTGRYFTSRNGVSFGSPNGGYPPGLQLNSNGTHTGAISISGLTGTTNVTPGAIGTFSDGTTRPISFPSFTLSPIRFTNLAPQRTLPPATVGQSYSYTFTATGGTGSYTYLITGGAANGLSLSSGGVLSGTPSQTNYNLNFTIRATDTAGVSVEKRYSVPCIPATASVQPEFTTRTLPDGTIGDFYAQAFYVQGGRPPYTFALDPSSSLPEGAYIVNPEFQNQTLDASPGALWAKVKDPGIYSFVVRATDSLGNQFSREYKVKFGSIALQTTNLTSRIFGVPFSQDLFLIGGRGPYTVTTTGLPLGVTLSNDGILSGTPGETGTVTFTANIVDQDGQTMSFVRSLTINAASGPTISCGLPSTLGVTLGSSFPFSFSCTGSPLANPNYVLTLESGSLPPGMRLISASQVTGSLFGVATTAGALAGNPTQTGLYTFVVRATDASGSFGLRQTTVRVVDAGIITTGLPNGVVGVPYSRQVIVQGNTAGVTCDVNNGTLPTGLTINPNTCLISGTPTSRGVFTFGLRLVDSAGSQLGVAPQITITIAGFDITTPRLLPTATGGIPYSVTLSTNSPTPVQWLPVSNGGIVMNTSTGVLSGTTTANNLQLNVTATNGTDSVQRFLTLPVRQGSAPEGFFTSLPNRVLTDFQTGQAQSTSLFVSGGVPPYSVSLAPGSSLPPGLAVGDLSEVNGGVTQAPGSSPGIYGRTTASGNYTFTLRYADSTGVVADRIHQLRVSPIGLAGTVLPNIAVGVPYSFQLVATGVSGAATFTLAPGQVLPTGLSLSSSGLISGTALVIGSGSFQPIIEIAADGFVRRILIVLNVFRSANGTGRLTTNVFTPITDIRVGQLVSGATNFFTTSGAVAYTVEAGELPPGVQLLPSTTSQIFWFGVATTAGNYSMRLRATDGVGNVGVAELNFGVSQLSTATVPAATLPPVGRQGAPYSFQLTGLGGRAPYTFSLDPLSEVPSGITLSPNGLISGVAMEASVGNLFVVQTDADGKSRRTQVAVNFAPPASVVGPRPGNSSVRPAIVGTFFSQALDSWLDSGTGPFAWTLASGALPPGIALVPASGATSAQLAGTPTTAGNYSFTVGVTDANGKKLFLSRFFQVTTTNLDPAVSVLPAGVAGVPYSVTFLPGGPDGPYTIRNGGDIPPGLTLSPTGVLSGVPTLEAVNSLSINLTGQNPANNISFSYRLNIAPSGTAVSSLGVSPTSISANYVLGAPAPTPIPINVSATSGTLSYTVATSGGNWLSLSSPSGSTPGATNLILNPTGLLAGSYNGTVTINSVSASNGPLVIPVSLTVQAGVTCSYSLSPSSRTVGQAAGSSNFSLTTNSSSCNWSAVSNTSWITVRPPTAGGGSATVVIDYEANPGATRSGTVNVGGAIYTLTQFGVSCDYTAQPTLVSIPSAGGASLARFFAPSSACSWTPASNQAWLTVTNAGPFSGTADVPFTVAANASTSSRSATITVGSATVTVNQAGAGCTFGLSSNNGSVSSAGGSLGFNLSTGAGCSWTIDSGPSWIQYGGSPSGTGPGAFSFTIAANSSVAQRSGTVLLMGQPFTVTQAGLPCSYSLSDSNPLFTSAGGNGVGSVEIATGGVGCSWTVDASAPWLTPASTSGSGSGTVSFSLAANPDTTARSAKLIIAGQQVNVSQAGTACSYQLLSTSASAPPVGSSSFVRVVTSGACSYSAVSNAPWITLGSSGFVGSANVNFTVAPNPNSADRSGTVTIAGQSFAVTQAAQPCVVTPGSSSFAAGAFGGGNQFTYTTSTPDCNPPVQSFSSWVVITPSTFANGSGTVNFTLDANNFAAVRTAQIKVGTAVFTVTQAASPCSYLITPGFLQYNKPGGDGVVSITAAPVQCAAPPISVNAPSGMLTLTGITNPGAGAFTQNLTVNVYESLINYIRSAQVTIGGQILNIKQRSW